MVPPSFELWSAMSANGLEADGDGGAEGGAVGGAMGEGAGGEETAAKRLWRSACGALLAPSTERSWDAVVRHSPGDTVWHSLNNCVNYQARVWIEMLASGVEDVLQPAAFKLALVLRHTPAELTVQLLTEVLRLHPQSQDLTSYVLALLTDDEGGSPGAVDPDEAAPVSPAPLRDLQLFGDCELAVLAAPADEYDAHAALVRQEYARLTRNHYNELRVKVLSQFTQIPQLFHTPEFTQFERRARENIDREVRTLRAQLGPDANWRARRRVREHARPRPRPLRPARRRARARAARRASAPV